MTGRRGFSLLEVSLAMAIGAMVLVAAGGLFTVLDRSERVFTTKARQTSELHRAQVILRRGMMSILVDQGASTDKAIADGQIDGPPSERPRLILGPDGALDGAQRFEVVLAQWPVPASLMSPASGWAFSLEDDLSLDFTTGTGSGGAARGVFEVRRDGARESMMDELGLTNPLNEPASGRREPGLSLWLRRMPGAEITRVDSGEPAWGDGAGDPIAEARRLASGVRLASGMRSIKWRLYRWDEWVTDYRGWTNGDLPSYIELEMESVTGQVTSWLFEVGWRFGQDPAKDYTLAGGAGGDSGGGADGSGGDNGADGDQPGTGGDGPTPHVVPTHDQFNSGGDT